MTSACTQFTDRECEEDNCCLNVKYHQLNRLDILCGSPNATPNPCEKCKKTTCRGKGKCKGHGAWSYGISLK
jgi:hypothetical protein